MFLRLSMPEPIELIAFKERLAATSTASMLDEEARDNDSPYPLNGGATPSKVVALALSTRIPFLRLLKGYWDSLALQVMFELWYNMAFYTFAAWFPGFYHSHGVAALTTQGMQMASLFACAFTVMLVGYLCDKGLPCMQTFAAAIIVSEIYPTSSTVYGEPY